MVSRTDFEDLERKHSRLEANVKHADSETNGVKETIKSHQQVHDTLNHKLKEINESVYTMQNVQLQSMNTKLMQTATMDQLATVKKEIEDEVNINLCILTGNSTLIYPTNFFLVKLKTINFVKIVDDRIVGFKTTVNDRFAELKENLNYNEKKINDKVETVS